MSVTLYNMKIKPAVSQNHYVNCYVNSFNSYYLDIAISIYNNTVRPFFTELLR